jgi:hypothetical protein
VATANARWLQLWEIASGAEAARIELEKDWYDDPGTHPVLRFRANGRFVSLSMEYRHRFWSWQPDDLIESACALLVQKALTRDEWDHYLVGEPYRPTCATPAT